MHLSIPPLDFYTLGHVLEMTDWSKSDIALDSCREDFVRGATSSHFPFIAVRGGEALGG